MIEYRSHYQVGKLVGYKYTHGTYDIAVYNDGEIYINGCSEEYNESLFREYEAFLKVEEMLRGVYECNGQICDL